MTKSQKTTPNKLAIFQARNGAIELKLDKNRETFWVNQKQIAEIFGVDVKTINEHINNIYKSEELQKKATICKFQIVQKEGKREVKREIYHYNLDVIISVGCRINSKNATKFRIWATKTSVLCIQKWDNKINSIKEDYNIFMAVSDNSGEEIYEKDEATGERKLDKHNHLMQKHDLEDIAKEFEKWGKKEGLSFWRK